MQVRMNKVINGLVVSTKVTNFEAALSNTTYYLDKYAPKGLNLVNKNDLNQGWWFDCIDWDGSIYTLDFQPIID